MRQLLAAAALLGAGPALADDATPIRITVMAPDAVAGGTVALTARTGRVVLIAAERGEVRGATNTVTLPATVDLYEGAALEITSTTATPVTASGLTPTQRAWTISGTQLRLEYQEAGDKTPARLVVLEAERGSLRVPAPDTHP